MKKTTFQFHHLMMVATMVSVFTLSFVNALSALVMLLFGILNMTYDIANTLRKERKIEVTVEVNQDGVKDVNVS